MIFKSLQFKLTTIVSFIHCKGPKAYDMFTEAENIGKIEDQKEYQQ